MEHCTGNIARVVIYHVIMHPISDISTPFLGIPLFLVRQQIDRGSPAAFRLTSVALFPRKNIFRL